MLPNEFWTDCNLLGEERVRQKLLSGELGHRKRKIAREWLRQQELKRTRSPIRWGLVVSIMSLMVAIATAVVMLTQ